MTASVKGTGTPDDPWTLQTPSLQGEFQMARDPGADPPALICTVGSTELRYHLRAIEDLHAMLVDAATGFRSGAPTSRSRPRKEPSRHGRADPDNPVGGWYGLKKGLRGRFGNYVPPVLEVLGLAEVEHNARNNRMRAI